MKQRQIKFRAWDGDEMDYGYIDSSKDYENWGAVNEGAYFVHRNIVLMQFTGLIDKNGKEIYEGDILGNAFGVKPTVVEWNIDSWTILGGLENLATGKIVDYTQVLEIIGNIYQNPELLK